MVASLHACATHGQAHLRAYLGAREQTSIKANCTIRGVTARYTSSITACLLNPTAAHSEWKYTAYPDNSETYKCVVTIFFNGCDLISYVKKNKNKIPTSYFSIYKCSQTFLHRGCKFGG